MATFRELSQNEKNQHHKRIFEIIADKEGGVMTEDGPSPIDLASEDVEGIKTELYGLVVDAMSDTPSMTGEEMRKAMTLDAKQQIKEQIKDAMEKEPLTKDGYFNPVSGVGTLIDPGLQTQAFVPVALTPTEAAAYYTSGGIPQRIIDKKAGCLTLDGIKFQCASLTPDDLTRLSEYADKCGFTEAYRDGVTQALIFGGAAVYPALFGDSPISTEKGLSALLKDMPNKDFIKWWVTADRWSVVFVPDYNITAKDYLYARTIFVPMGGCRVNTERVAMIRPKKLPFWSAIKQLGWSTSDFEGWIKDYESYEIMKASLPIMAQQMSLMYHSIPADGLIVENGPEYAKQYFQENEKQMREWSMFHPKAINAIGEIKILDRTYSGFQQLISEARLALCSSSGLAESVLFAEKATGLASDNRDDVALKQSETIRLLFNNVAPAFQPCIQLLVYSCFGKDSEQAKHAREVTIEPDSGVVLGDQEKAQLGQSFVQIIGGLVGTGLPMEQAVKIASDFVPSANLDEETMNALKETNPDGGMGADMWGGIQQELDQANGQEQMQ